ncbi:type I polyketide synthase [Saccharibacillus brassicae]|uniref:Type I polyketide synthase n=1 Tax=Saccharibacillus brassicae TaxID=2583377 RepID=A0A4Y6UTW5_SACBS|nr:type I polyketide synthase [Saccharibacillus brassicae]QDH19801.1 type I polyketide synthase [Saccharibacillus brassicae]
MRLSEETIKLLKTTKGIHPVTGEVGLHALQQAMLQGNNQIMVYHGDPVKIRRNAGLQPVEAKPKQVVDHPPVVRTDNKALFEKVNEDLVEIACGLLKMQNMDIDHDLMQYGFDSISITVFTNKINDLYELDVMPTVIFELEQPTIRSLVQHLCEKHADRLRHYYRHDLVDSAVAARADRATNVMSDPVPQPSSFEENELFKAEAAKPMRFSHSERNAPVHQNTKDVEEPIAIIGMNGIFPQADNLDEFWDHLVQEKQLMTEIPEERFDWRAFGDPKVKWGGFMKEVDKFDAAFFGISAREAEVMDPQHRLFLQVAWGAIEEAGYKPSDLSGTDTGIFVGIGTQDYAQLIDQHLTEHNPYALTGRTPFMLVNRISSMLNLHGPSEPIDTACSSSLVALHKAAEAIRRGTCRMAIAGGVNVILTPSVHLYFSEAGMLSDNGECNVFDKDAGGTVRSEGVGAILLKRMSDAIADGDHIHGVIQNSAQNHKGKSASLTAPNANAQADLLIDVYGKAKVDPTTIGYIETHSTGTRLGDPIEIAGLKNAFSELYSKNGVSSFQPHCALGSLKTNIGHLETAAGIGAVIKVLLSLKNKTIPGTPGFKELNPYIKLSESPFYINEKSTPWDRIQPDIPRRAGVSAFGFGGVNAHVMIEEYIDEHPDRSREKIMPESPALIVLSAANGERLTEQAKQLVDAMKKMQFQDEDLRDIAYTLQVGREAHEERLALTAASIDELRMKLSTWLQGDNIRGNAVFQGKVNKRDDVLALLAQDEGMGDVIEAWFKKGEYNKLLSLWVRGLALDWNMHYPNAKPRRVSLPTYPFERQRHWLQISNPEVRHLDKESGNRHMATIASVKESINSITESGVTRISIGNRIINLFASLLGVNASEIDRDQSMVELGADSIILTQVLQQLQSIDSSIDFETIYNCISIREIINVISISEDPENEMTVRESAYEQEEHIEPSAPIQLDQRLEYPELIRLNKSNKKRPVFWFHGGFGGVEIYRLISNKIERPFYGVQAKGYMTDYEPIEGIEAMAAYYVQMIQSVQPEGPYDFGGLSLGGMIAYEVARQMQEQGETVNSIVMLESIYVDEAMREEWLTIAQGNLKKDRMLRAINLLLAFSSADQLVLIADHEVQTDVSDEAFLDQLVLLAEQKGITKPPQQLRKSVVQYEKILDTLDMSTAIYDGWPLSDPHNVPCYYFCNPTGTLFGEDESYFRLVDKGRVYDYVSFAAKWKEKMPALTVLKVKASNHLTLLTEPESQERIVTFCEKLYSDEPIPDTYLKSLSIE